jgi:branched-chain amino acid transport system permease protein
MTQQIVNAISLGSIYTLFALGLTLSWGVLNVLNLAHGAIFMFGAMAGYVLTKGGGGLPLVAVLPLAMLCSGVLAATLEVAVLRAVRRRAADRHAADLTMLIASVAAGSILVAVGQNIINNEVVALPPTLFDVTSTTVLGVRVTDIQIVITVLALVMSGALAWFIRSTRHGRALRALSADPYICGLVGISANRTAAATLFVSGAIAGAAGILLAVQLNAVEAQMGDALLLKAFAVIILGGVGSVGGAVAGAFILAAVETGVVAYVDPSLKDAVAFVLIIVLLLLRPQGLISKGALQRA